MNEAQEGASLVLAASACGLLCRELSRASGIDGALAILETVRRQQLGDGLMTVNMDVTPDDAGPELIELERAWSSRPGHYPVAGRKRKTMTPWTEQLFRQARTYVGEGDQAITEVFGDSALILSMGLRAFVNVPLVTPQGQCFATLNVLGPRARWQRHELLLIELMAALAQPAVARHMGR